MESSLDPTTMTTQATSLRPLCVDLDGTLIAGDSLWESGIYLLRHHPIAAILSAPVQLMRTGRAGLKQWLATRAPVAAQDLPYRREVVDFLHQRKSAGQSLILATAADSRVANGVADHLKIFDSILSSDGLRNLKGEQKLRAISDACPQGFDYIADHAADLPIWAKAGTAYVVAGSPSLLRRARAVCQPHEIGVNGQRARVAAMVASLRPTQWAKNALLLLPLIFAHQLHDVHKLIEVVLAIVAFCLCASASYVLNDMLDVHDDRRHAEKIRRPFAAGDLPLSWGPPIILALLIVGVVLAAALGKQFLAWLTFYFFLTSAYSLYFKRKLLVDVIVLAGLYTLRILAGGAAVGVEVSPWLLAFSIFLFLSLAFIKRYVELMSVQDLAETSIRGRGYMVSDLEIIQVVGPCSGYLAVLVFALYIHSSDLVTHLYKHPLRLWLICPLMLYWITRVWILARRRWLKQDPVLFAVTDRVSWYAAALAAMLVVAASL